MENQLLHINKTPGVLGSIIFQENNNWIMHKMPSSYNEKTIGVITKNISQVLNSLEATTYEIQEIEWEYEKDRILARKVKGGVIIVLGSKNLNIAVLNLTVNAVLKEIEKSLAENINSQPQNTSNVDLLNPEFFIKMLLSLSKIVGPIAGILIEEKLQEMKTSANSFPKNRVLDLIEKISKEIDNVEKAEKFKIEMLSLVKIY